MLKRKDVIKNLIKIIKCLEASKDWLWYREISRRTGLHHKTISRLIEKYLTIFLDIQNMEPFNIRMVRLKPGTDTNSIIKFLVIKERIESKK